MAKQRSRRVRARAQAQTQRIELVLENPAHGGAVTAHDGNGHLYFVRYGLPGERVVARVTSAQSKLSWAEVESVIEPSPLRSDAGADPSADLQHVARAGQLSWKRQVLADQLRRVGGRLVSEQVSLLYPDGVVVESAPGDSSDAPVWGSRTRAKFKVTRAGQLGTREYRSHRLKAVSEYPLLNPLFAQAGVFTDSQWRDRWRPGDVVTLIAPTGSDPRVLVGGRAYSLAGEVVQPVVTWTVEADAGTVDFQVAASGFWQTHREAASLLVDEVLRAAGSLSGKKIIELYSGSGLFTYYLARAAGPAGKVLSLEGSERAVRDAERNLRDLTGAAEVEMFVGMVDAEAVATLSSELGGGPDLTILDPPREGAGREVVRAISESQSSRVVLVSCDPAAGARDLRYFTDDGFRIVSLRAWDLFPATHHMEFVAELVR